MSVRGREYLIIPQIVIEAIEKQLRDERNNKEFEGGLTMNKKQTIELLKARIMMFAHEYLTFVGNKEEQNKRERLNAEISDLKSILESLRIY